ncbi:MAG: acyl-CoA thioesterase [Nitrososphaerales archaeon]|nr:acyl-CoA thioesterase [Nitrososphaerales archaeon]
MFRTRVRVRISETDFLGVVYYGNYYTYFDVARLEMLRSSGIAPSILSRRGLGFVAAESSCTYHASARFDDLLTVAVEIIRIGDKSVTYMHTITKGRKRIAEGTVTDVMVDRAGRPKRMPEDIGKKLSHFMARRKSKRARS